MENAIVGIVMLLLILILFRNKPPKAKRKPSRGSGKRDIYRTKVVGVTFKNSRRVSRQDVIAKCRAGEQLKLVHAPVKQDRNAVEVRRAKTNEMLGYLSKELAAEIGPLLAKKRKFKATITKITGGGAGQNLGCNIQIERIS